MQGAPLSFVGSSASRFPFSDIDCHNRGHGRMSVMSIEQAYEALKSRVRSADLRNQTQIVELAAKLRSFVPQDLGEKLSYDVLTPLQIKALVELFYVYDHYGDFGIAKQQVEIGPRLLEELESPEAVPLGQSPDGQSRVRLAVAYGVGLYRDHELEAAKDVLLRAQRILEGSVAQDLFLGTRGELAYALGRVYRQQQMFLSAAHEFERAISFYHRRVDERKKHGKSRATDETFSRHKIAIIIGLAVGWCNYTQGRLSTAISTNLIPARMLLRSSNDELNASYADVIYASACRARGSAWDSLDKLFTLVNNAKVVFTRYRHKHYISGASIELALIELARKRYDEAEAFLDGADTDLAHPRWQTWMGIVRSRIARARDDKKAAFRLAERAFSQATVRNERLGQIEALIAMSESRGGHHDDSVADLIKAKKLNQQAEREGKVWSSNLKIDAICTLHMVKQHLASNQRAKADKCFKDWVAIQDKVEHAHVRKMAETLSAQLTLHTPDRFELSGLNFPANRDRMLLHLIEEAEAEKNRKLSYRELGEALGVSTSVIRRVRGKPHRSKNKQVAVTKAHA
jgi:tetratricopeptide (TPR) repeat protein